ncbi:glycosyltransferase family 61 protein (plasmid) [Rhodobacteraceae bacterium M382]|nr:glycosyltransferase family 61 protein [Rhodobacteraceae bacterium M382]
MTSRPAEPAETDPDRSPSEPIWKRDRRYMLQVLRIASESDPETFLENLTVLAESEESRKFHKMMLFIHEYAQTRDIRNRHFPGDANIMNITRILNRIDMDLGAKFVQDIAGNIDRFPHVHNKIRTERLLAGAIFNPQYYRRADFVEPIYQLDLNLIENVMSRPLSGVASSLPGLIKSVRRTRAALRIELHDDGAVTGTAPLSPLQDRLLTAFNETATNRVKPRPNQTLRKVFVVNGVCETHVPRAIVFREGGEWMLNLPTTDLFHHATTFGKIRKIFPKRRIPLGFVAPRTGNRNYYHSLIDRGRYLFTYKSLGLTCPIYWCGEINGMDRQILDLLDIPQDRIVCTEHSTSVRPVLMDVGIMVDAASWSVDYTRALQSGRTQVGDLAQGGTKLFVSRANSTLRRLENTQELEEAFRALGFEIFDSGGYTIAQQAEIFSRASVVAGLHGAGLANAIFSPRGCRLIEITSRSYLSGVIGQVALDAGHRYYPILCDAEIREGWRLDVGDVIARVQECLKDPDTPAGPDTPGWPASSRRGKTPPAERDLEIGAPLP